MPFTLKELAASLGAETLGDASLLVDRLAEPKEAREGDLALAVAPKFAQDLKISAARAAVVWPSFVNSADLNALGLDGAIVAPRGRLAMAGLTRKMDMNLAFEGQEGIHPSAVIDPSAQIGEGIVIGPFVVIAADVTIGKNARIGAHVSIGREVEIGPRGVLHAGVRIGPNVVMGCDCIVQMGAAIGGDGFSFTTAGPSNVERAVRARRGVALEPHEDGTWHRIHSLGGVVVGDHVEIGANSTIDAGTIRPTRVSDGCKIDNLVQVGHNVVLGEDCLLCAQAAIAGSSVLGPRVIMGGKSGIADNLTIGRDVVVGGGGIVLSSVADGLFVAGHPAKPNHEHRAEQRALRRLAKDDVAQ